MKASISNFENRRRDVISLNQPRGMSAKMAALKNCRVHYASVYVSGWCGHGFESHSQPFLLTYSEADLSLWHYFNFTQLIFHLT